MIIMARDFKKYIAFLGIGMIFGMMFKVVPSLSKSVFSVNNDTVVICDAGHRGYALCFKQSIGVTAHCM